MVWNPDSRFRKTKAGGGRAEMSVAKESKKETRRNVRPEFPGEGSPEEKQSEVDSWEMGFHFILWFSWRGSSARRSSPGGP